MDRTPEVDKDSVSKGKAWRARVLADLQAFEAYEAAEQQHFGGIDEMMLVRYEAGKSTDEERKRVEQAIEKFPAVRESIEFGRELSKEWQETAPINDAQQKRPGVKPWADRADRPETPPRTSR